mmetsp:Transcript_17106/g.22184  ORF Transcript_17106/g.22184 Transcript_17106/m.22184 type:complete len:96 (-) Transcript_17106:166-453(-)
MILFMMTVRQYYNRYSNNNHSLNLSECPSEASGFIMSRIRLLSSAAPGKPLSSRRFHTIVSSTETINSPPGGSKFGASVTSDILPSSNVDRISCA